MPLNHQQIKQRRIALSRLEKGIVKLKASSQETFIIAKSARIKPPSEETIEAHKAIQLSKMWLGQVLNDMGAENPYPNSTDATNDKIEPTADVSDKDYNFDNTDHILMVKELREDLSQEIEWLKMLYGEAPGTELPPENTPFFASHIVASLRSLEESKMWLGMELSRINDLKNFERKTS